MLGGVANQADMTFGAAGTEAAGPAEVLRALAHPVRWGILCRLAAEPGTCACDFTEFFEVSQPTISAHLKVLREAGLVTTRRDGTTICYSIAPGHLETLSRVLAQMAATATLSGARQ
jgi:ArsR family transcriptional regulator, arsenate/arsenite/antimonite-responsive transcriptional repressor